MSIHILSQGKTDGFAQTVLSLPKILLMVIRTTAPTAVQACAMVTFAKQDSDVVTFTCLDDKPDVDIPTIIRVGA